MVVAVAVGAAVGSVFAAFEALVVAASVLVDGEASGVGLDERSDAGSPADYSTPWVASSGSSTTSRPRLFTA